MILEADPRKNPVISTGFFILFTLFTISCGRQIPSYYSGEAQGTTFTIVCADQPSRDLSGSIDSLLNVIDLSLSTYHPESRITAINNGKSNLADEHIRHMLIKSREFSVQTRGAFDVTVGRLSEAWGFGAGGNSNDFPDPDTILPYIGYEKVILTGDTISYTSAGIRFDFNAIAQGYTVDLMARMLEQNGIDDYMVEIGGEVFAKGKNEEGEPWKIGIDKPVKEEARQIHEIVSLTNLGLATSGNYRKFRERDGRIVGHSIDPRTGYPVEHNVLSVSVIAGDCTTADALATAFMVMGPDESKAFISNYNGYLEAYFILADEDGGWQTWQTANFPFYREE